MFSLYHLLCMALMICLYFYSVFSIGRIEKGIGKRIVLALLTSIIMTIFFCWNRVWLGTGLVTGILVLFDLFYDEALFIDQWWKITLPGLIWTILLLVQQIYLYGNQSLHAEVTDLAIALIMCLLYFFILSRQRGYLRWYSGFIVTILYAILMTFPIMAETNQNRKTHDPQSAGK